MKISFRMHRRLHFQLLEVMIALLIVALCALPILSSYMAMSQAQVKSARLYDIDHLVHLTYGKIVEDLYHNRIPWQDIVGKRQENLENLTQANELATQFKRLSYQCQYQLNIQRPKQPKSNSKNFLIELQLHVIPLTASKEKPLIYSFLIYLYREPT